MLTIEYRPATVAACDYIGRTVHGVCAVVLRDGVEVFRTRASVKRIGPRLAAEAWIAGQRA